MSSYDDGSVYAGAPPPTSVGIVDLTDRLRGEVPFHCERGTAQIDGTFFRVDAGVASVDLDNSDRALDPTNLDGPYVSGGETLVVPGVPVYFVITVEGTDWTVFTGSADGWPQNYSGGVDQTVTLSATDGVGKLANTQFDATFPKELAGTRVARILNNSEWPTAQRVIGPGNTVCAASDNTTYVAWSALCDTAESDWGTIYADHDDIIRFEGRVARITKVNQTNPQAIFGDGGGGEVPFNDLGIDYDAALIYNDVTLIYNDQGDSVNVTNTASQAKPWGLKSWNRSFLIAETQEARVYAEWIADIFGNPAVRFNRLVLQPAGNPNLWVYALGLELSDRIQIALTPAGGGDRILRDAWIRGIQHDLDGEDLTTTFTLEDAQWALDNTFAKYDLNLYDDGSVYYI